MTAEKQRFVAMDEVNPHNDIRLQLAADLAHLPIIRSVAATIAAQADFDVDAISDLRLAVDEACSTLIANAQPGATLECGFTFVFDELRFTGSVLTTATTSVSTTTFGWRVLTTLTDSARSWISQDRQGGLIHIELVKRRTVGA